MNAKDDEESRYNRRRIQGEAIQKLTRLVDDLEPFTDTANSFTAQQKLQEAIFWLTMDKGDDDDC